MCIPAQNIENIHALHTQHGRNYRQKLVNQYKAKVKHLIEDSSLATPLSFPLSPCLWIVVPGWLFVLLCSSWITFAASLFALVSICLYVSQFVCRVLLFSVCFVLITYQTNNTPSRVLTSSCLFFSLLSGHGCYSSRLSHLSVTLIYAFLFAFLPPSLSISLQPPTLSFRSDLDMLSALFRQWSSSAVFVCLLHLLLRHSCSALSSLLPYHLLVSPSLPVFQCWSVSAEVVSLPISASRFEAFAPSFLCSLLDDAGLGIWSSFDQERNTTARRESFRAGQPADVPGSFLRTSRVKNFGQALETFEKFAFGCRYPWPERANVHNPKTVQKSSGREISGVFFVFIWRDKRDLHCLFDKQGHDACLACIEATCSLVIQACISGSANIIFLRCIMLSYSACLTVLRSSGETYLYVCLQLVCLRLVIHLNPASSTVRAFWGRS